jgi:CAAX prenyl protease-like protein
MDSLLSSLRTDVETTDRTEATPVAPSASALPAAVPYVAPFVVFLLLTECNRWFPGSQLWGYPLKTALTGILLWVFRKHYREITADFSPLAVVVGLLTFALWVPLYGGWLVLGSSESANPYEFAAAFPGGALVWIGIRLLGASLIVPVMEELFWRSWLLRYLVNPDFTKVPLGAFTGTSLVWSVGLFGAEHFQWVAGMVAGLLYTLLLYRTKSLSACILAHAVTNCTLGIYTLTTQQWQYW